MGFPLFYGSFKIMQKKWQSFGNSVYFCHRIKQVYFNATKVS